jgi:hypothetical protein
MIDEAGREIEILPRPEGSDETPFSMALDFKIQPDRAARRIARVKGTLGAVVQTAVQKFEVLDVLHAQRREVKSGKLPFVITCTPAQDGWFINVLNMPSSSGRPRRKGASAS